MVPGGGNQGKRFVRLALIAAMLALLSGMMSSLESDAALTCDIADISAAIAAANNNPSEPTSLSLTLGCFYTFDGPDVFTSSDDSVSALPELAGHLIITGNGATINRADGAPAARIFSIGTGGNLELDGVSIMGGDSQLGAGILNRGGTLKITSSYVENNSASGGLGGGIVSTGTAVIRSSTIRGNSATLGGGVANLGGDMTLDASTITANSSDFGPAGIYNLASDSSTATLTLVNSTIAANGSGTAGIGVLNYGSTVNGYNVTIALNPGGGINNQGGTAEAPAVTTLWNTIVAENGTTDCDISQTRSGGIVDASHNLDSDGTCGLSLDNHSLSNTDPQFVPGGPTHELYSLLPVMPMLRTSPAINAGDDAVCAAGPVNAADEIDTLRPQGAHCDIGAYEQFQPIVNVADVSALDSGETITINASLSMACAPENEPCPPITPDGPWTFGVTDQAHNQIGTPISQYFPSGVAQVSFSLPPLAPGAYIITVDFQPNDLAIPEGSGTGTLTVTPGAAASLTLNPGDTSASVGQMVTEVATVLDSEQYPVADGTVVNYVVTGDNTASGTATTLNGQALISYSGAFIGSDTLTVTAVGGSQPSARATIDWTSPPSTPRASVTAMSLGSPTLQVIVNSGARGQASGSLSYAAGSLQLSQIQIEGLTVSGSNATIFGTAHLRDRSTVSFRLELTASRFSGGTARMQLSNGYDSGQFSVPILRVTP